MYIYSIINPVYGGGKAIIRFVEELSLNAWAALQTMTYDGWIIRFSNGYTKRANSVSPMYDSTVDLATKIRFCEDLYHARKLKPTFKMTGCAYPSDLDDVLESRGYSAIDQTSVQLMNLSKLREPSIKDVRLVERLDDDWLESFCTLNNQSDANRTTMVQMFSVIIPKTCFISLYVEGKVVACGLGVLERGYLGIFDIVTDSRHRNRGYGEQLMLNLLKWGGENGARYSYLQVMIDNASALKLYSKVGYNDLYRYWYRVIE